jgi:ssDNA-binding Zn-finger/Zn-ribbon topoisomerase 1
MMKRVVFLLAILVFCFDQVSKAQVRVLDAEINSQKGRRFVNKFQRALGQHPGSFLIKANSSEANGIADYLLGTFKTLENAYLHVYYGKLESGDTVLVMTGATLTEDNNGHPVLKHDNARSAIWVTKVQESHTVVPYDKNYTFVFCDNSENCDISNCGDGIIDEETAAGYIANFQQNEGHICSGCGPAVHPTESFLLPANAIRAYLKRYPDVAYLQVLMGGQDPDRPEKFTILVAGLDNTGHHLWDFNEARFKSMFGDATPCPKCKVVDDRRIDHHRQDGIKLKPQAQIGH